MPVFSYFLFPYCIMTLQSSLQQEITLPLFIFIVSIYTLYVSSYLKYKYSFPSLSPKKAIRWEVNGMGTLGSNLLTVPIIYVPAFLISFFLKPNLSSSSSSISISTKCLICSNIFFFSERFNSNPTYTSPP